MIPLRDYQTDARNAIYQSWQAGNRVVAAVLPTGSGKTVLFSDIIRRHRGPCCAIAHRQELVTQISQALARDGVLHRIVGPPAVVRLACRLHTQELGRQFFDPQSPIAVAGVDTLIRRGDRLRAWAETVTLWVQDECHHLLRENKWGRAVSLFPNARGLGVTATPMRADGRGLGRHADGVIDDLIVGPGMRELITRGYLTDYRIFAPPSDIDLSGVRVGDTGDYVRQGLRLAVQKSHIIGDVVTHYQRHARGRLGVTFATDVQTAEDITEQYISAGVPAATVHAKTPDTERVAVLERFRRREILQLVNVDIFGEGFDLPAIEAVSMARPTQSYGLYAQQFGRGLRPMDGKAHAVIIDHVGNVMRHGLPDAPRTWTLDRRERRASSEGPARVKVCPSCTGVYERVYPACPYCGYAPVPARRDGPEWVDGDLTELDAATLARMRGEVAAVDRDPEDYRAWLAATGVSGIAQAANMKRHYINQEAQRILRDAIAQWAGYQRAAGRPDAESYRRFWLDFGIDVMSAQGLKAREAGELTDRITGAYASGVGRLISGQR